MVAAHPNPKVEGKNLLNTADSDGVYFTKTQVEFVSKGPGSGFVSYRFPRAGSEQPVPKISYATEYKPYGWALAAGIYVDDVDAIFWSQVWQIGALVGIAMLLVVGMSVLLGRSIVKPITGMTAAMRKLAGGDTRTEIPARERGDEVGAMAQSVQIFKDNMVEAERLRGEQDALKLKAEAEKKNFLTKMADEFETGVRSSLDTLGQSATGMRSMSQSMSATAEEASRQATTVAAAASQATSNVQTVAVATEELSSSVSEIGRQVTQSTQIAAKAVEEANRTNQTVQGLSAAAQKIGDVVKLISDIASQTNLLALNATIEAARAGEGRPRLRRGGQRGEVAGKPDREGNGGDLRPGRRHAGRDRRGCAGHRQHRRHHRLHQRDRHHHRIRGGTAGRGDAGDRPQCAAGGAGHRPSVAQHRRR